MSDASKDQNNTEATGQDANRSAGADTDTAGAQSRSATPAPASSGGDGGSGGRATDAGGDGPQRPGRPLAVAVVALLVALLVAAAGASGGWWLWERLRVLEQGHDEFARQGEIADLREDLNSRSERLTGRVDNLAQEHASHVQTLAQAEETMASIRESQARAQERMDRIRELAAAHRDDWILAEAGYLYGVARYRTRFHGDVDGALQALKEADRLLEELGASTVEQRQAVSEAINALLDVRKPDREGLAADIRELIEAIDTLPLKRTERQVESAEMPRQRDAELDTLAGWRQAGLRAWQQFRDTIGSLVVVRRGEAPPRLMAPEESHYLRENLRLQLLTARAALMDGSDEVYRHSLADVADWMGRHFDGDDEQVQEATETVQRLREADLRAELPDLGAILPQRPVPGREADEEDAE